MSRTGRSSGATGRMTGPVVSSESRPGRSRIHPVMQHGVRRLMRTDSIATSSRLS
ncbi:hypothetical protein BSLA_01r4043 [Burkholderia stabilis]|nr:hypothetical protein BSLA_01r4043 [Burkholderia stabilis]